MINAFDNLCNKILTEKKAKKTRIDSKCWKGKKIGKPKTKVKNGVRVNNCVPESVTGEKKFTPCDHCDHPAKCEAAGKCLGGMVGEKNAKCTGPTKKASSTSKGKKYMKCVKSDSGGYKRIHWGQKGAKVTGKSGNTKRKKSFRARHKCSTAKSNTPRGQACKDW